MSLYRGAGGASDATDDSTVNAVAGYASAAASSATAAAASASTASSNADAAAASAASAASNVSQAATSASNALTSESNASTSATNAASSASAAAASATAANLSAGEASSAAAEATSRAASSTSSSITAGNRATAAAASATAAAASAASALAIYGDTVAMEEAVADAVEAAANAQQEAQSANDSAIAAEEAKSDAYEHEQNAAEWASQAQGSANSAQGFSTAAQAARDATLQAYDNFDDRYLGTKSADPTVDNDGNPLVAGALYFNDQTNMMMLRAGGAWVAAYTSGGSPSFGNTVVNGTLNVTGVSTFSAGTAAAPAITPTGDSNTGIFFPAADTIAFSEGGTEAMRIDANGRRMLGTTTPSVVGGYITDTINGVTGSYTEWQQSGSNTFRVGSDSSLGGFLFTQAATPIRFGVNSVEQMRIASNGRVGIGSTNPVSRLHVDTAGSNLSLTTIGNAANGLSVGVDTDGSGVLATYAGTGTIKFGGGISGGSFTNERMRLDNSGNLGLGTSAVHPSARFDVRDVNRTGNLTNQVIFTTTAQAADVGGTLGLGGLYNATQSTMFGTIRGGKENSTNGNYAGYLSFGTVANGGSITERARIDSNGNLLVGVTSAFNSSNTILKGTATNDLQLTVGGAGSVPGVSFHWANNTGTANAANSQMKVGVMGGTSRSISAAGTINASGADYAEYMTKAGDFTIAKGDVVGINAEGKLTNVFADAISFCVKSTDPSYVGGDVWGCGFDGDPEGLEAARQCVDRIAFAGQVPVNVFGTTPGQLIIPVNVNGAIKGIAKNEADITLAEYMKSVGRVIAVEADGRAKIIVKVA